MEFLSPGVFPREVDFSAYVQGVSTSTFGIVGVFQKGPVGEPTLVTSFEDARRKFGDFLDAQGFYAMHALKSFFDNGGARAFVVRTCHYEGGAPQAQASTVSLQDRDGAAPQNTLQVDAVTPGTWGDDLSVEITASDAYPTTGFNLIVKTDSGTVLETFADLLIGSGNAASEDYVEKRINGVSQYIRVTDLLSTTAAPDNRPAVGTQPLAGGADGLTGLVAADFIGDAEAGTGLYALDTVDVNFIAIPGESDTTSGPTLAQALITYAEGRKDCIAIIEAPRTDDTAQKMVDFRMGTGVYSHTAFNSSYGAVYGPWLNAKHPVTSRDIVLPPSGFVAGIFARNDAQGAVWTAPAGLNRGTVLGADSPVVRLSKGDRDIMYVKGVNPIAVMSGALVISGQKTLQLKASATDRVNVRRLMAFVEKSVTDAAQSLVFEPNYKKTWEAFKRMVGPFLQRIKDGGGFYDFKVICDETINTPADIDANVMRARVLVKPTKTAEFIAIDFAIAPTGADFSEL